MKQSPPCKLSILVVSYNHRPYIGEAMESILQQDTDFKYEIVVADDCSTDETLAVIREFQSKYPDIIRILDSDVNLGITRNYQRGFAACQGEYLAVLEGDDYWLGKDRLQTLVHFMDEHLECVMAFNRILYKNTAVPNCRPLQWDTNFSYELKSGADLAYRNFIGNFSACIYRSEAIAQQPETLYDLKTYDWLFNLSISRLGLIAYLPQIRSVYRQHSNGTWSGMSGVDQLAEMLRIIPIYDSFLQGVYAPQFQAHLHELQNEYDRVNDAELWRHHKRNPFVWVQIALRRLCRHLLRKLHLR